MEGGEGEQGGSRGSWEGGQGGRRPAGEGRDGAAGGPELPWSSPQEGPWGEATERGSSGATGSLGSRSGARPAPGLRPALTVATTPTPPLPPRPPGPLRLAARLGLRPGSSPRPRPGRPRRRFRVCKLLSSPPRAPAPARRLLHAPISQVAKMSRRQLSGPPPRAVERAGKPRLRAAAACPFSTSPDPVVSARPL